MSEIKIDLMTKRIASHIRNQIFTNELREGEKVVEHKIASQVGTSRGPVREALTILENQGLIIRIPRRGAFVVKINEQDVSEIYTLRLAVEQLAVKMITDRENVPPLTRLQTICDDIDQLLSDDTANKIALAELDMKFHHELVFLSGNARALSVWENLAMVSFLLSIRGRSHGNERNIEIDHQKLIDLLNSKKTDEAVQILTHHLGTTRKILVNEFLEKKGGLSEQEGLTREFQDTLNLSSELEEFNSSARSVLNGSR
ncbi:MAG: GntR family transcriptional regulator [Spirochaetales bacterium]|nr:GntR family transcriptional regulator [Spirochaetales bacterium]